MATYDFVLSFALPNPDVDPAALADALFEAGCDDATLGIGKRGSIALDFSRDSITSDEAMQSAVAAVQKAIPGAELVEAKPDLVSLSDVAALVGCSRQNMRKYASGEIRSARARFPAPAFSGALDLWHLHEVATWLRRSTDLDLPDELIEASSAAWSLNLESDRRRAAQARRLARLAS